jgi:hypothetical protein
MHGSMRSSLFDCKGLRFGRHHGYAFAASVTFPSHRFNQKRSASAF